jgi:hypothetical protein
MKQEIEKKLWECLDIALTMKGNGEMHGAMHQLPSYLEAAIRRFFSSKENLHKIKSMKTNSSLSKPQNTLEMNNKVFKLKPEHFNPQPVQRVPCCGEDQVQVVSAQQDVAIKTSFDINIPASDILDQGVEEWSKQEFESLKDLKEWANQKLGTDFSDRSRKKAVLSEITEKIKEIKTAVDASN